MRTATTVENEQVEKRKELKKLNDDISLVENEIRQHQRDIITSRGKIKDLEISVEKGKLTRANMKLTIATLNDEKWSIKNGGC